MIPPEILKCLLTFFSPDSELFLHLSNCLFYVDHFSPFLDPQSDLFFSLCFMGSYHFHWIAFMQILIARWDICDFSYAYFLNSSVSDLKLCWIPLFQAYDVLGLYYGFGRTFFNPASVIVLFFLLERSYLFMVYRTQLICMVMVCSFTMI